MDLKEYMTEARAEVDRYLNFLLPDEAAEPVTIHRAMRYSLFAGGKRLRPVLILASGESIGGDRDLLLHLGAAVEMMHTYSLIHDDLPALDNDDYRRGRPTCHKVFGEAMAILAGDALLTRCYQVLAGLPRIEDYIRMAIVREISYATGTVEGMIGGQVVDLESEGQPIQARSLEYIHRSKTGALLTACMRCAALASRADDFQLEALTGYGRDIGLAFQIMDDILDITAKSETLGKTAGKDEKASKATYPALYGIDASRARARELCDSAIAGVAVLGSGAEPLRQLAEFICIRSS